MVVQGRQLKVHFGSQVEGKKKDVIDSNCWRVCDVFLKSFIWMQLNISGGSFVSAPTSHWTLIMTHWREFSRLVFAVKRGATSSSNYSYTHTCTYRCTHTWVTRPFTATAFTQSVLKEIQNMSKEQRNSPDLSDVIQIIQIIIITIINAAFRNKWALAPTFWLPILGMLV